MAEAVVGGAVAAAAEVGSSRVKAGDEGRERRGRVVREAVKRKAVEATAAV